VTLTWAASPGATNYFIKQSPISGGSYIVVGTNANVGFTNTGLNNGTIYYYVVSAQNVSGESTNSMEASARPVSLTPAQINLTIANSQMQLVWPQNHTGWQVQVQTNAPGAGLGTNWITISGSGLTNQFNLPIDAVNGSVFIRLISP
jgi:cellulose 1,4-beta-cellobiosidase